MDFITSSTVAFITGGSKGIGRGFAEAVLKQGGSVFLVDMDTTAGTKTLKEFQNAYGEKRAAFFTCNVTVDKELLAAFNQCREVYGHLDILFNNAGIGDRTMIWDEKAYADEMPEDWKTVIDVNLTALVNATRLAIREMRRTPPANGGVIINISSLGGFCGQPYSSVYSATKHAVIGYTRSIAPPLKKYNIRVVGLSPGFTDTNLVSSGLKESQAFASVIGAATKVSGGLLTVDHIIEAAVTLLNEPSYNGHVISVSRELGMVLHENPAIFPKNKQLHGKARALPHKVLKEIEDMTSSSSSIPSKL